MTGYFPTKHAVAAMSLRDISWQEILGVVSHPEVTYRNTSTHGPTAGKVSEVRQRGKLFAVVSMTIEYDRHDPDQEHPLQAVITCGLREQKQWTDSDVRNRRQP